MRELLKVQLEDLGRRGSQIEEIANRFLLSKRTPISPVSCDEATAALCVQPFGELDGLPLRGEFALFNW